MMKVEQLMTRPVHACRPSDRLDVAARVMWERDCGCVPVVAPDDGGDHVVGMITDRDVCMAAYTQGLPLTEIAVETAMAHEVRSCRPTDSVGDALRILEGNQLHRLPVVDAGGLLVGMVSLADLAREAAREHGRKAPEVSDVRLAEVVEAISTPRSGDVAVVAA
jgi:CBS domain-containing protein